MQLQFSVGTLKDRNGQWVSNPVGKVREAREHLSKVFGGLSVLRVDGSFTMPNGEVVHEGSVIFIIETDGPGEKMAKVIGSWLRDKFNQQSVMLSVVPTTVTFIED